jgi:hypothetical protein
MYQIQKEVGFSSRPVKPAQSFDNIMSRVEEVPADSEGVCDLD